MILGLLSPTAIILCLIGVIIGIIFGAIPGMTATMAVAVFLPVTYAYPLTESLALLLGLYVGGISGGLVPATLINIPGTPSSICTTLDAYPMAKNGEPEKALKIGVVSSFFGGIFSLLILYYFAPALASMAIKFSSVEKFLIILLALTVIASLSKGSLLVGIFSGFLGVFISLIGQFGDNNRLRLVPPGLEDELIYGFTLLPVLIGLFAISQILKEAEEGMKRQDFQNISLDKKEKFSLSVFKGQIVNLFRSAAIGTFVGILPGIGGSAASFLSYSQAKNFSKEPEKLGTGVPEGIIASEASNNGLTGGALVPLLSLGIPGDSTTAVLVGAFLLQGIQVGPLFIGNNPDLWKLMIYALLLANIIMFIIMYFSIRTIAKLIYAPKQILYPIIIVMCVIGAYSINNGIMFDVWTLMLFGLLGYVFDKIGIQTPPFLVGFILGGQLEKYFMDSIKGSGGSLTIFFTKGPIAWILWILIIVSIGFYIYQNSKQMMCACEE